MSDPCCHYLCYATANDRRFYLQDIKNIANMCTYRPGVETVVLLMAISRVRPLTVLDRLFVQSVRRMVHDCCHLQLNDCCFKDNVGRDFSSYGSMYRKVQALARDNDYVFFRNRSACGPFCHDWYQTYIRCYEGHKNVAMVGDTINFYDHPDRSKRDDMPHIQTYTFLTQMSHLRLLGYEFPGEREIERLQIITKGEIALSDFFLDQGLGLACLEWPEARIDRKSKPLAVADCKESVSRNHPFYHRRFIRRKNKKQDPFLKSLTFYLRYLYQGMHETDESWETICSEK